MLLPVIAAALLLQDPSAPREASIDVAGATRVHVIARAGSLTVRGRDGLTQVRAHGTARASDEKYLDEIRLSARRNGGTIEVVVDIPDRSFVGFGRFERALDLEVEVPTGMAMDVEDTSGDLEIHDVGALDLTDSSGDITLVNIGGALRVDDSSGGMRIDGVHGDVHLRDSSGDIVVHRVVGSVEVEEDSSGYITVTDVSGSFTVDRDSSGDISAETIGGDFVVRHDSSGGIDYRGVKGRVEVPARKRRG